MKNEALKCVAAVILTAALGAPAWAAGETGSFDLYYVPLSKFKLSDSSGSITSDGGRGYGVKGQFDLDPSVFLTGEYQANSFKGFEGADLGTDIEDLRLGVGYGDVSGFFALGEFVHVVEKYDFGSFGGVFGINSVKLSGSGWGLHGGYSGQLLPQLDMSADIGYLDAGKDIGKGIEFRIGGAYALSDQYALFADYRQTEIKDDSDTKGSLSDLRLGFRFLFR